MSKFNVTGRVGLTLAAGVVAAASLSSCNAGLVPPLPDGNRSVIPDLTGVADHGAGFPGPGDDRFLDRAIDAWPGNLEPPVGPSPSKDIHGAQPVQSNGLVGDTFLERAVNSLPGDLPKQLVNELDWFKNVVDLRLPGDGFLGGR